MERSKHLGSLVDTLSKECFGMSLSKAHKAKVCIQCRAKIGTFKDEPTRMEYEISGLCPKCQDEYFDQEE